MPGREKNSYTIQSVANALDLLEALCEEGGKVRIRQFSEKLGMDKSKVFRLLATFESKGYVERVESSDQYCLGFPAFEMGQKLLLNMELLRQAKPAMESLARKCNEAVYLVIRRKTEVLFLDVVDTTQLVRIMLLVGRRFPLEEVSAGKMIAACSSPQAKSPELNRILHEGACIDQDRLGDGIASLAVPLFQKEGVVCGALCMVGPSFRMTQEVMAKGLLPHLKEAGESISSKLGYVKRCLLSS